MVGSMTPHSIYLRTIAPARLEDQDDPVPPERLDFLLEYVRSEGRVCPMPNEWDKLHRILGRGSLPPADPRGLGVTVVGEGAATPIAAPLRGRTRVAGPRRSIPSRTPTGRVVR